MNDKLKNRKSTAAANADLATKSQAIDTASSKKKNPLPDINVVVSIQTTPIIPTSVSATVDTFAKLKQLAHLVERHYDRYTHPEEKATLYKLLNNLTELDVSNLTFQLNDVEKSQAAMLIRQIIKDHTLLERVHLQDNTFAPPDLQFIVKALIYVFYAPAKKHQLSKVNLNNSVSSANLERSGAELMQLRKAYGNNIALDAPVYNHFIDNYRKVTNHYLHYLAKKIILPKAGQVASGTEAEVLQAAEVVIRQGLPAGTKNKIRFELAVKKFQALRLLTEILQSDSPNHEIFEKFQAQYKASKKALSKTINKDDDTHLDRFYEQIGDVKPQTFIPLKKDSHSIFKTDPKKKKRAKKTKGRAASKKATQPA